MKRGPQVSPLVAVAIIIIALVGVAGMGLYVYNKPVDVKPQPASAYESKGMTPEQMAKLPRVAAATPEGQAQKYRHTATLLKQVAGLNKLLQAKENGLSGDQKSELLPVMQDLQKVESLNEVESAKFEKKINDVLNEAQRKEVNETDASPPLKSTSQPFGEGEAKEQLESLLKGLQ
jgi:hypothetical protein